MPRHHSLCSAKVSLVFGDRLTLLQNDVQKEMHVLQRYRWAHCPERLQSGQQCPRCVLLLLCELFTHYPQPSFSVSICVPRPATGDRKKRAFYCKSRMIALWSVNPVRRGSWSISHL